MEKPSSRDIAAFPELFDGMEDFIEEQAAGIKRTGVALAVISLASGMAIYYLLESIF